MCAVLMPHSFCIFKIIYKSRPSHLDWTHHCSQVATSTTHSLYLRLSPAAVPFVVHCCMAGVEGKCSHALLNTSIKHTVSAALLHPDGFCERLRKGALSSEAVRVSGPPTFAFNLLEHLHLPISATRLCSTTK